MIHIGHPNDPNADCLDDSGGRRHEGDEMICDSNGILDAMNFTVFDKYATTSGRSLDF